MSSSGSSGIQSAPAVSVTGTAASAASRGRAANQQAKIRAFMARFVAMFCGASSDEPGREASALSEPRLARFRLDRPENEL